MQDDQLCLIFSTDLILPCSNAVFLTHYENSLGYKTD
jgi:hypothetical protein